MIFGGTVRILVALLALTIAAPVTAGDSLTPEQKSEVEKTVREYLLNNPGVVLEAIDAFRAKQEAKDKDRSKAIIAAHRGKLENDPNSPVGGNPKGDVTMVEFFDYRCGYCKRVFPAVVELLNTDGNIRYVFKEFPILGDASVFAARAALAAWKLDKDKYFAFHTALMGAKGSLSEDNVMKIASDNGLPVADLRKAMEDPEIDEDLKKNSGLAQALGITGTPAFIIGDDLIPGAVSLETLKKLVALQRGE